MTQTSSVHKSDNRLLNLLFLICMVSICATTFLFTLLEEQQSNFINDVVLVDVKKDNYEIITKPYEKIDSQSDSNQVDSEESHPNQDSQVKSNQSSIHEDKDDVISSNSENNDEEMNSKQRIINILQQSGVDITPDIESKIPTWGEVVAQYGSKPQIVGLDTCSNFQSVVPETDAYIGPSGIFNTGTNLFADLLLKYCELPKREVSEKRKRDFGAPNRMESGMLWHVPWGKHNPISWRLKHKATVGGVGVEQTHVLPVVTIKDPLHWIGSMCRHPYAASWKHSKKMCPNLIRDGEPNAVVVPYRQDKPGHYDSLVGLWNDWYGDYLAIKEFPRLIIRFEDILFHFEEVITQVCKCGGGALKNHENGFVLQEKNAKAGHHNGSNGLVAAVLRYGHDDKRTENFTEEDLEYVKKTLRRDIVDSFGYFIPADDE